LIRFLDQIWNSKGNSIFHQKHEKVEEEEEPAVESSRRYKR
jgi:hypothetical protein